jgi:hypothetical protein
MDNRTRAEKIAYLFRDEFDIPPYLLPKIEAILDEAVREAIALREANHDFHLTWDALNIIKQSQFHDGFAAAREKAAEIVRHVSIFTTGHEIRTLAIERIQAMEADGKEGV